jgi:hypothetical protein
MPAKIVKNAGEWKTHVLESEKPVLAYFHAPW